MVKIVEIVGNMTMMVGMVGKRTFFSFLLCLAMMVPESVVEGSQDGWEKTAEQIGTF